LITKPEKRLTANEALQHRWIKNLTSKKNDDKLLKKLDIGRMKKF